MSYLPRELEDVVLRAAKHFPVLVLTGPRRAGKTWLLKHLFPKAQYFLLEDPVLEARLRSDPKGFLEEVTPPVILDEIQNVPEVFAWVRSLVDAAPEKAGSRFP